MISAQQLQRPMIRFLHTPKGLLLVVFGGLFSIALLSVDAALVVQNVGLAAVVAGAVDLALTYALRRAWILPDGAVLTGMIVAFVMSPQVSPALLAITVAVAIIAKHALRTRWSNILNPAAVSLVFAAIVLHANQSWWGALPDLGVAGAVVLVAAGVFMADRLNKLTMVFAFLGAYFFLFAAAGLFRSATVSEIFVTPDLQAALFFAFFMLDDPPTSPVRHEDQVVFGVLVASVAYFLFMQFGGVYFLPGALLAGNAWESARRTMVSRRRAHTTSPETNQQRRLRVATGIALAAAALPVALGWGIATTGGLTAGAGAASLPPSDGATAVATNAPDPYPFLATFQENLKGTFIQTNVDSGAHFLLDGLADGDLAMGLHIELIQESVVAPPDDESAEAVPDDEAEEARPHVTTTVNTAQLFDPASRDLLCDGKLTGLGRGTLRFTCDGIDIYTGTQMQIGSRLNAGTDGTIDGTLSGVMQHGT